MKIRMCCTIEERVDEQLKELLRKESLKSGIDIKKSQYIEKLIKEKYEKGE